MSAKLVKETRVEYTHLDVSQIPGMRKAEFFDRTIEAPPAGLKNRFDRYLKDISRTSGRHRVKFDDKVRDLLLQYALEPSQVISEIEYLNRLEDENGDKFSRNLKVYSLTTETFRKFSLPDHTTFRWNVNYQKSLEKFREIFSKAYLKPISYTCDEDIRNVLPKANTHSGWTYIETGLKKKGENMDGVYKKFCLDMDDAITFGSLEKPILIGFRTQASGEYADDGARTFECKHKTRVVCMVDLIQIILELKYAKPIQDFMSRIDYYAGGKDPNNISTIIRNGSRLWKSWWSLDYSGYDMTVSSWLIEDAFSILRCAFREVDEAEWNIIVNDFIHKNFVVNEGVVHSDRGIPSGSMFTQIIGSLVNLIVIQTYFNAMHEECFAITMGDDNLVFHNLTVSEVDNLASYVRKNFGLEINPNKCSVGTRLDNPKFLSREWRVNGQWRHPNALISRMLFPERHRDYSSIVGPEHVILAFILTYPLGMEKLIDVRKFRMDYPITNKYIMDNVGSRYLPGALAYIREYTM